MQNPSRVAFTIFGKDIYWYGVLMALGILLAVLLSTVEAKRKKMKQDFVLDMCLVLIPSGIVGARLYYVLFELEQYLADPIRILYIWEGGLAFYGAMIGGLIGMFVYAKVKKLRMLKMMDIFAPGLVLAQAIGRWGNFFNQEAFGFAVTDPNMMWFPLAVKIDGLHYFNGEICTNPYHLATFFYESLWCLLVFLALWFIIRKRTKHDGDVFCWYLLLYGFERMLVEPLRGDSLWLIPGVIRVSQMLSLLFVVGVAAFFLIRKAREKKLGRLIWPTPEAIPEEAGEQAAKVTADTPATETEQPAEETAKAAEEPAEESPA
ncbi:MAG: prolipoprotein diacylglyceryl transferase, partial [Eubacteriales bacterium]|nr:prolipoprotein diacylglyceryl transferase [Eubacteriales bacterium]